MKKIKTINGHNVMVDDEDFERLNKYNWYALPNKGVITGIDKKIIYIHRFLFDSPVHKDIDHINHNRLDNRKINLRVCSKSQNHWNTMKHVSNKSGYKGVSFHKNSGKWEVRLRIFGKKLYFGIYNDKEEAAKIYDQYAKHLFGEYALTNF